MNFTTKTKTLLLSILLLSALIIPALQPQPAFAQSALEVAGNILQELTSDTDTGTVVSFTDFEGDLSAPSTEGYAAGLTQATDLRTYIKNVVNFFLGFLGLIAVVIIIYGGYMTVLSGGDPAKASKGKQVIISSAMGILIIMGSFAIVNTLLKAPSDNEKGGTGLGGTSQTIRGVSGKERYNFLAIRMQELMKKLAASYDFHFNAKVNLEQQSKAILASLEQIDANCDDYTGYCDDWKSGISDEIGKFQANFENYIAYLNTLIASPTANITIRNSLLTHINEIQTAYNEGYNKANSDAKKIGCQEETQTIGDSNYCNDDEAKAVVTAFTAKLEPALKKVNQIKIKESFGADLTEISNEVTKIKELVADISLTSENTESLGQNVFDALQLLMLATAGKANAELVYNTALNGQTLDSLKTTLTSMNEIADLLKNLKFVNVALSADIKEGNAPLIVNFSSVGSSDPSGLSITNPQIFWDLNGNGTFEENVSDNCSEKSSNNSVASCLFDKPGTYRVTLKIKPNSAVNPITGQSWTQEIAPGIAYLDIKVNPPSTKINLSTEAGGTKYDIIKYNSDGFITENRSRIYFTEAEAKGGITFDATSTQSGAGTQLSNDPSAIVKWNFGTETPENNISQVPSSGLKKTIVYPGKGIYLVVLEVTDRSGVTDRKVFTIVVSDLAPRLINIPKQAKVNEEVKFDGSYSTSSGASIIFNWTIEKTSQSAAIVNLELPFDLMKRAFAQVTTNTTFSVGTVTAPAVLQLPPIQTLLPSKRSEDNEDYSCALNDSMDVLNCRFKRVGQYKITLFLQDENDLSKNSEPEVAMINIFSNAPIAGFTTEQLQQNTPALYLLNAESLTFDPDEQRANLEYSWEISPSTCTVVGLANSQSLPEILEAAKDSTSAQISCESLKDYNLVNSKPVVKFNEKGSYSVSLLARNFYEPNQVSTISTQTIQVDSVLDLAWGEMKPSSFLQLPEGTTENDPLSESQNDQPVAPVEFIFGSSQAIGYEIEFGDGETESGDFADKNDKNEISVIHNYIETGKFKAKLTVFDADDVENSITRSVYISNSDKPVAVITVKKNGVPIEAADLEGEQGELKNVIVVNRKDIISFDAASSVNTDGQSRRLKYDWNINNSEKQSTTRQISHQFKDLSDKGELFPAKLKVTNERDVTQFGEDTINFMVTGEPPTAQSLNAIPDGSSNVTPVTVNLRVNEAKDADGQITQYKWWYSPADDQSQRLGLQITKVPNASIVIGTNGEQGEEKEYIFGLELTDNDNLTVSTDYEGEQEGKKLELLLPKLTVINGANKAPISKFTVDRTTVNAGEAVNFSSSSIDPDEGGSIKTYDWDFGDGTRETGANKAAVSHTYSKANVDGYKAKLIVTDIAGSTAVSDSIKIFVEAQAQPPIAAFTSKQVGTTKEVKFQNTSTADEAAGATIKSLNWDFDVTIDSNGDGLKDNDPDSRDQAPSFTYSKYGIFRAKLTVTDSENQIKSVTNFVNVVPEAVKPTGTTGATSAIKTMGANIFEASNTINPLLVLGSAFGYVILLLVSRKNKNKIED